MEQEEKQWSWQYSKWLLTTKKNWPQGLPPQKENGCPGTAFDALRYLKTKDTL
ncbi:hypothetical protein [Streptococcus uberis]|uniref:hypothetical protein n=1 Tax=Streptococcus uberis TaxID=1349 RepID=UPI0020C17284|nr:hypothetical protein [Streptococcus uberis]